MDTTCIKDMKPKSKFAADCMKLHDEFKAGDIKLNELDAALAALTMENLKLFKPSYLPRMPELLIRFNDNRKTDEWRKKSHDNKIRIESKIYNTPDVKHYILEKQRVEGRNDSDQLRLETCAKIYPDDQLLKNVINNYEIVKRGL